MYTACRYLQSPRCSARVTVTCLSISRARAFPLTPPDHDHDANNWYDWARSECTEYSLIRKFIDKANHQVQTANKVQSGIFVIWDCKSSRNGVRFI